MITNYDINPTNCKVDEKLVDSKTFQACFQTTKKPLYSGSGSLCDPLFYRCSHGMKEAGSNAARTMEIIQKGSIKNGIPYLIGKAFMRVG
ncbi:hypothetical protein P4H83_06035 [Paenibacillus favisporus]|uniref:hypothetical protein n=1 Tax=Paenibacillus favisporus TaxID=221028 RepID=UPI002DBAD5F3|nr:hypothetical protein [Paenibacillus favisporus]MEC0174426.1 hypothetical protein [Paenibacillus favisporus]